MTLSKPALVNQLLSPLARVHLVKYSSSLHLESSLVLV